jgi:hypothetical protein
MAADAPHWLADPVPAGASAQERFLLMQQERIQTLETDMAQLQALVIGVRPGSTPPATAGAAPAAPTAPAAPIATPGALDDLERADPGHAAVAWPVAGEPPDEQAQDRNVIIGLVVVIMIGITGAVMVGVHDMIYQEQGYLQIAGMVMLAVSSPVWLLFLLFAVVAGFRKYCVPL